MTGKGVFDIFSFRNSSFSLFPPSSLCILSTSPSPLRLTTNTKGALHHRWHYLCRLRTNLAPTHSHQAHPRTIPPHRKASLGDGFWRVQATNLRRILHHYRRITLTTLQIWVFVSPSAPEPISKPPQPVLVNSNSNSQHILSPLSSWENQNPQIDETQINPFFCR